MRRDLPSYKDQWIHRLARTLAETHKKGNHHYAAKMALLCLAESYDRMVSFNELGTLHYKLAAKELREHAAVGLWDEKKKKWNEITKYD